MICNDCIFEADLGGEYEDVSFCRVCGFSIPLTKKGRVERHPDYDDPGPIFPDCEGSGKKPAKWGHAACKGCDCMHKPAGAWNGGVRVSSGD